MPIAIPETGSGALPYCSLNRDNDPLDVDFGCCPLATGSTFLPSVRRYKGLERVTRTPIPSPTQVPTLFPASPPLPHNLYKKLKQSLSIR